MLCFVLETVLFLKLLGTTPGFYRPLRTGVERMALGTYFNPDLFFGRTGFECLAAGTNNPCFAVLRMNAWFHLYHPIFQY